jgi:hypothetical protein
MVGKSRNGSQLFLLKILLSGPYFHRREKIKNLCFHKRKIKNSYLFFAKFHVLHKLSISALSPSLSCALLANAQQKFNVQTYSIEGAEKFVRFYELSDGKWVKIRFNRVKRTFDRKMWTYVLVSESQRQP